MAEPQPEGRGFELPVGAKPPALANLPNEREATKYSLERRGREGAGLTQTMLPNVSRIGAETMAKGKGVCSPQL